MVAFFTAVAITSVFIISMKSTEVPAKIITISDCRRPLRTAADKNAFVGIVVSSIVARFIERPKVGEYLIPLR